MKKRIIVIGANGFLGATFINQLDHKMFDIKKVTSQECNLLEKNSILFLQKEIMDDDVIIFCAAQAPAKNWEMFESNMLIVSNFIDGVKGKNIKYLLNVSSDAVYSDSETEIDENSKAIPDNPHGYMHYVREKLLDDNLDIPLGHIRPTLVFGTNDPHNGYGPNMFLRLAKQGKNISLFGEGEELRDHIHVKDVAKIAICMIENQVKSSINAVSSKPMTFFEIADLIKKESNLKIEIIKNTRTSPMPHNGLRIFKKSKIKLFDQNFEIYNLKNYIKDALND